MKTNYLTINRSAFTLVNLLAALTLFIFMLNSPIMAEQYEITELGTLGGIWSGPAQIDGQGRVVGGSTIQSGAWHAFKWDSGQMQDLDVPDDFLVSSASGFNSQGQVVGYANGQYQSQYAYLWENNSWTALGTLPGPLLDYSVASDINENSQICGYSFTVGPGSRMRAWIWENGTMTDLGSLGGDKSSASAINELGQVVGYAQIYNPDEYQTHAFIWEDGEMTDLGVLPGEVNSSASDINENGQIVGASSHQQETYPFLTITRPCLWENGQIIELELPEGFVRGVATGINNEGTAVGWMATTLSGGSYHAFVWKDGALTDLNSLIPSNSGWELQRASDINDNEMIIGDGVAPEMSIQGYLLTPVLTSVENDATDILPTDFISLNNYPNPFNASTNIRYTIPNSSHVTIEVYDILGRNVAAIDQGIKSAGKHQVVWDGKDQPSGLYFYRLNAGQVSATGKMALLK